MAKCLGYVLKLLTEDRIYPFANGLKIGKRIRIHNSMFRKIEVCTDFESAIVILDTTKYFGNKTILSLE